MPFQAVETTEARTVWVESPIPEMGMGFLQSARVEIVLNPEGVSDWSEPGTAYRALLMAGLWPDDHELALMTLGYVPGSEESADFLTSLVDSDEDGVYDLHEAHKILLAGVTIMPTWAGQTTRMIFVNRAFATGTAKDDAPNVQRTGKGGQRMVSEMSFEEWKLMLDLELSKRGLPMADDIYGDITDDKLRHCHDSNLTVKDTADAIETAQRDTRPEPVDAEPDAGSE